MQCQFVEWGGSHYLLVSIPEGTITASKSGSVSLMVNTNGLKSTGITLPDGNHLAVDMAITLPVEGRTTANKFGVNAQSPCHISVVAGMIHVWLPLVSQKGQRLTEYGSTILCKSTDWNADNNKWIPLSSAVIVNGKELPVSITFALIAGKKLKASL